MKYIIETEELEEAELYLSAPRLYSSLFSINNHLHELKKWGELSDEQYKIIKSIHEYFYEIINENNITI